MKFFLIAFAVIAAVSADVSHLPLNEYLPPVQEPAYVDSLSQGPINEYLPPVNQFVTGHAPVPIPAHELADDGYRYKTQRRVVYRRHRRDVSHLPLNEYLPPLQHESISVGNVNAPINEYLPPGQSFNVEPVPAPAHELADDGYRYKTQRRVVYRRNRRDVSHLPTYDYLPPVQQEYVPDDVAPIQEVSNTVIEESAPAHELADDGYRYKTQRRVVYRRNRRDVSHLASSEYLPPVQEASPVLDAPVQDFAFVQEAAPAHELADDGYRYKTQRRVVYRRNRRDVSHLASSEYLPPVQDAPLEIVPYEPVSIIDEAAPSHELADDGYRYKTQRRVVYRRNRRDVSHLPSNEYLPPTHEEYSPISGPVNEYLPPVHYNEPSPAHELSNDGYRYKTQRRVVYRRH